MFLVSTLYHAMDHDSPHKQVFRILDHIFIYFAIAGSYTPVALCLIKGYQGIIILVIQWAMVIVGILYKSISIKSLPKLFANYLSSYGMDSHPIYAFNHSKF